MDAAVASQRLAGENEIEVAERAGNMLDFDGADMFVCNPSVAQSANRGCGL
jgi:hypothetical protein